MDDLKKLFDLGTEALAVFKDHISLLLAVIVIVFLIAARLQRVIDNGEIRGLKAQNDAIKEQLALAESKHDVVTSEIETLEPEISQLKTEVAELKASPLAGQIEALKATTTTLAGRVDAISQANTALGMTFASSLGAPPSAPKPPVGPNSSSVDLSLYHRLMTGGWMLNFNPVTPRGRKKISFNPDGTVGDGKNQNEFKWLMRKGFLEIYRQNDALQNRFRYDESADQFICTNDQNAKGIRNQIIYRAS